MAKEKPEAQELNGLNGKGVERVSIPEVDAVIKRYVTVRDKRQEELRKEVVLKNELIELLTQHKEKLETPDREIIYHYQDEIVRLKHGKVKLKIESAFEEDEE